MDLLQIVVSLASGGLAGALVNWSVTLRRQRTEITLKLIEAFFSMYSEIGHVQGLIIAGTPLDDPVQLNRVRKLGDWFDLVAALCDKRRLRFPIADTKLLRKIKLHVQLSEFYRLVQNAPALMDTRRQWKHLERFCTGKKGG